MYFVGALAIACNAADYLASYTQQLDANCQKDRINENVYMQDFFLKRYIDGFRRQNL